MKKTILTISMAMVITLPFACKKKESTQQETNTTTGSTTGTPANTALISYSESGATVNVDSANAVLYTSNDVGGPRKRKIDIYAFKSGKQVLEFHFIPKTGAQTVAQNFDSAWLTFMTNNGLSYPEDYYNCASGNFNLSLCDTVNNKLTGTFDFVGNNGSSNKTLSNGSINLTKLRKQ